MKRDSGSSDTSRYGPAKRAFRAAEDEADRQAFRERANEPLIPFEKVLRSLRRRGR